MPVPSFLVAQSTVEGGGHADPTYAFQHTCMNQLASERKLFLLTLLCCQCALVSAMCRVGSWAVCQPSEITCLGFKLQYGCLR